MSHSTGLSAADILKCVVSIIIIVLIAGVRADPGRHVNSNFASVPTTVKTRANDSIMLPCKHNAHHQYIRWIRDGELLMDSREPDLMPPDRFSVDIATGSLLVLNVRDSDNGEYVCEVQTAHGLATQQHAIEVLTMPTVVSVPSGIVELNVGGVFEIVCEARGVPYPMYTWRHNGQPDPRLGATSNNSRRLLVSVSDRHMAGRIECVATNGVGEATAGPDLLVLFSPEVQADQPVVHTKLSLRAYLECNVIAHPVAKVHWFHHGVPITYDQHIARQDSVDTPPSDQTTPELHTRSKHVLIIKKVRDRDLGHYECRASNKIGYASATVQLTGRPMPAVFKPSPVVSSPLTHNLIWQTESLSPIIEYCLRIWQVPSGNVTPHSHRKHHHGGSSGRSHHHEPPRVHELIIPAEQAEGPLHTIGYVLRGLQPASVYEVSVTAKNRYGESDASKTRRFATGGEIEVPDYTSTESVDYTAPMLDSREMAAEARTKSSSESLEVDDTLMSWSSTAQPGDENHIDYASIYAPIGGANVSRGSTSVLLVLGWVAVMVVYLSL